MDPRTLTVESSMQVFRLDLWQKARWLDSILMRYPTKYQSRTNIPQLGVIRDRCQSLKVFLKAEENRSGTSGLSELVLSEGTLVSCSHKISQVNCGESFNSAIEPPALDVIS
ncbi:hypothetical protein WN943_018698 [Citrus x changshan-huyou]